MPSSGTGPPGEVREVVRERLDARVVPHVLVAVGHHRAAPVPAPVADDVHLAGEERVGRAHDRADVEVVLPVLDRDVEVVAAGVEVGDDRLQRPVAVAVHHVAPVALGEQLLVVHLAAGPVGHGPGHGPTPTSAGPCGIGSYGARRSGSSRCSSTAASYEAALPAPAVPVGRRVATVRLRSVSALLAGMPLPHPLLLGIDCLDPQWLLAQFGAELFWISLADHLRRVRAVLPVPARRHPAVRARASSSPPVRSTCSRASPTRRAGDRRDCDDRRGLARQRRGYEIGRRLGPPLCASATAGS